MSKDLIAVVAVCLSCGFGVVGTLAVQVLIKLVLYVLTSKKEFTEADRAKIE